VRSLVLFLAAVALLVVIGYVSVERARPALAPCTGPVGTVDANACQ
jgi:hypothetical protein